MRSRRDASAVRERLHALSRTAYTAAAGHLEVDPAAAEVAPRRRRWALSPRAAAAAALLLLVAAGAAGLLAATTAGTAPVPVEPGWSSAQEALGGAGDGDAEGAGAGGGSADGAGGDPAGESRGETAEDASVGGDLVVHVAGCVAVPGVVRLPAGSRVHEAVAAAGGATAEADLDAVNLARVLVDGEQVYLPAPGEAPPGDASSPGAGSAGLVDLNRASLAELDALPGIGPVLAQRILDWRAAHGRFTSVEELGEVAGIGPTLLGRLRDLVTV